MCNLEERKQVELDKIINIYLGNIKNFTKQGNILFFNKTDYTYSQLKGILKGSEKRVNDYIKNTYGEKFTKGWLELKNFNNFYEVHFKFPKLLSDAYEVKEGNKSIEELNPRNLEYFNGDEALLEQEEKDDLKPFIDESKKIADKIKDVEQQVQEKTIKPGVEELFDQNPELANAVYEALGFKQNITKDLAKSKHDTDEHRFSIGNFIKEKNSVRVTKNREGDFSIHEGDLSELTKQQKIALFQEQSNAIPIGGQIVQRGASSFDGIRHRINLKNHGFSIKYQTDNLQEYKSTNKKEVQEFADLYNLGKVIEKDGKLFTKGVILTKEQNTNFVTTQQKQQAQQLYSQYLNTIFPDSKVAEIDDSLYNSVLNQLEQENKIEKDCNSKGKLKAEKGLQTNFTKGGKWKLIKDLKGYPTHKEGGVDLTIGKNGVSIKNGNTEFTAKHGLVIPKARNGMVISNNNPVAPPARFESEFYRLYASGKGLGQYKKPDRIDKGWIFKNEDREMFVSGTQDQQPTGRMVSQFKNKPIYTDSYIIKGRDGYPVKANSKGRLYPDISNEYPAVEIEGDKHWNIAKYAYAPFFGMTETDGYHYNSGTPDKDGYYPENTKTNPLILPESDADRRKMLEEDIRIYYNSFDDLSPEVRDQKTKEFMINNIDPLINSHYHKYNKLGVKGLGRVDEDRGKDADWFEAIDKYNIENPNSKITDAYDGLIDYNIKFRKLDEKQAKLKADEAQSRYLSEKNKRK